MRKLLIPLLLASALAPATAYAKDGPAFSRGHQSERGDRGDRGDRGNSSESKSSDNRPQRAERAPRVERSERADRPVRVEHVDRQGGQQQLQRRFQRGDQPTVSTDAGRDVRTAQPTQRVRRVARDGLLSGAVTADRDGNRDGDRWQGRDRDNDGNRWRDRDGSNDRWRDRNGNWRRWTSDWRRDNRYDWHSYRNRYGSIFRLGRYYDPYGYGYRRFSIGFNLWPSYYGSSFWLDDPWQYRLPPAYGPYRWIRYYDDALLVNIYTGQVVDVIHNVFW